MDICCLSNEGWGNKYHCTALHFHLPIWFLQNNFFCNVKVSNIHLPFYPHNFNLTTLFRGIIILSVVLTTSTILNFYFDSSLKCKDFIKYYYSLPKTVQWVLFSLASCMLEKACCPFPGRPKCMDMYFVILCCLILVILLCFQRLFSWRNLRSV